MKISNKLPHFSEPTLIIVCNPNNASFYLAHEDQIEKISDFKLEKIKYSDREDFGRLPFGGVYETGSRIERLKMIQARDFKQKFLGTAKFISKNFNIKKLYMFSAKNIHGILERVIPKDWKKKVVGHLKGDFTKMHLFNVLKRIQDRDTGQYTISASIA